MHNCRRGKCFKCCKSFGQWLRESLLEWSDNPLDAKKVDIEMTRPETVCWKGWQGRRWRVS